MKYAFPIVPLLLISVSRLCAAGEKESGREASVKLDLYGTYQQTDAEDTKFYETMLCDEFYKTTGHTLDFRYDTEYRSEKTILMIAAGDLPDIFLGDADTLEPLLENKDFLGMLDFTKYIPENAVSSVFYESENYTMPLSVYVYALYQNAELSDKYGIPVPSSYSWSGFLSALDSAESGGITGSVLSSYTLLRNFMFLGAVNRDGLSKPEFQELVKKRAMGFSSKYVERMIESYHELNPYMNPVIYTGPLAEVIERMLSGDNLYTIYPVKFGIFYPWNGIDMSIMPIPHPDSQNGYYAISPEKSIAIPAGYQKFKSGEMRVVELFIQFVCSKEFQTEQANHLMDAFPIRDDVSDFQNDDKYALFKKMLKADTLLFESIWDYFDLPDMKNSDFPNLQKLFDERLKSTLLGKSSFITQEIASIDDLLTAYLGGLGASAARYAAGPIEIPAFAAETVKTIENKTGPIPPKPESVIEEQKPQPEKSESKFAASMPPILSISDISFSTSLLEAGETGILTVTVKNVGMGPARDLQLTLDSSTEHVSFSGGTLFPEIRSVNGTETLTIYVYGDMDLQEGTASIDIRVIEPNFKVQITGKQLTFETRKFQAPQLVLAKYSFLESQSASPNEKIDINEMVDFVFAVQNIGRRSARDIKITIENSQKGIMLLGVQEGDRILRVEPALPVLESGEYQIITYKYFINSEFTDDELVLALYVGESFGKYGLTENISVGINKQLTEEGFIRTIKQADDGKEKSSVSIIDIPGFPSAKIETKTEDMPRITVLDFVTGEGISISESKIVSDVLSSEIFSQKKFRVIDRNQRESILSEIKFSMSGCTDESCQLQVGRLLTADNIITGNFSKIGSRYIIDAKMYYVETGETIATSTKAFSSKDEIMDICKAISDDLSR